MVEDRFREADLLLHAGDLVHPAVLDILAAKNFKAVSGNMDSDAVRRLLPDRLVF